MIALASVLAVALAWSASSVAVVRHVSSDGATLAFPTTSQFSGTFTVPLNDAPPGTAVRLTVSTTRPQDVPAALARELVRRHAHAITWLRADLTHDVRFGYGTVAYRFERPDVLTTSEDFSFVSCDVRACLRPFVYEKMRRDGAALAFSTRGSPFHFEFVGLAGHPYVVAIYRRHEREIVR